MNLALWLERAAQRTPEAPAIFLGERLVATYAQFSRDVKTYAAALVQHGLKPGDRVALFTPNCPSYLVALFAIWHSGSVAVPINAKLHPKEAIWIAQNSGAALLLSDAARVVEMTALADCLCLDIAAPITTKATMPVAPKARTDLAWLFYTSGTTGRPKGVEITHGMLSDVSLAYLAEVDTTDADHCAVYAAPMTHGAGFYAIAHVLKGARHVLPVSGGFDPSEIFALAAHHRQASLFAAPTMVRRMVDYAKLQGLAGDGIKTVIYGGGPMYVSDIVEAVDVLGPRFAQIYGQGECPMCITVMSKEMVADRSHPNWRARLGSVGVAQSICTLRITNDDKVVSAGQIGEIEVQSVATMPGYWQNPAASAQALTDGWLKTGDMGALDEDGFLTLHDRSKDMIISGGTNIYPREVEELLLTHDAVREVAVIGRAHPDWGEEVIAVVVGDVAPTTLDALCRAEIAGFKRPKAYFTCEALPKNNYGKVVKTELRAALAQGMLTPLV